MKSTTLRPDPRDALHWDHLDPEPARGPRDLLGLSPEDRLALGLSEPRATDLAPSFHGDAHAALLDAMAKANAAKANKPRRR